MFGYVGCKSVVGGGAVSALNGTVNVQKSTFQRNNVSYGAGGALHFDSCRTKIRDTVFSSNEARNYAGIHATRNSIVNATGISIQFNIAIERGGGLGLNRGSSLLCTRCDFRNNKARWGAGIDAQADDSILVVCQLLDSTFMNNVAYRYGGKTLRLLFGLVLFV